MFGSSVSGSSAAQGAPQRQALAADGERASEVGPRDQRAAELMGFIATEPVEALRCLARITGRLRAVGDLAPEQLRTWLGAL
jgi:hypothetical protein